MIAGKEETARLKLYKDIKCGKMKKNGLVTTIGILAAIVLLGAVYILRM